MSKIKKNITESITREKLIHEVCDWCGKKSIEGRTFDDSDPRDDLSHLEFYGYNEFNFKWETGKMYPDSGDVEVITADLCNECRQKAIDLLKENGLKFRTEERSW